MDIDTADELGDSIREEVWSHFTAAEATNRRKFIQGDSSATSEYIYQNQKDDSKKIIAEFKKGRHVVSVQKRTKVGADGLMICVLIDMGMESGKLFTNPDNVRILTGMNNCSWEKEMIEKCPTCYKDKIFHHGQLSKANLKNLKNALIIIDEIDSGNKENQILHKTLKDAGLLNVTYIAENNIRFIIISATMIRELYELFRWGDLHSSITMTVPKSYIGHDYFLKKKIIQEFYPIESIQEAEKWIIEDILPYGNDYRVHIVRTTDECVGKIQDACIKKEIEFTDHNSFECMSREELKKIFEEPLANHLVVCVKGFYRRADLIPNKWKMRIGATHELHTKGVDNNVQVQGLPGRMTGYWKEIIKSGHKTGPYRTSIKAINEYEKAYTDPYGVNPYKTYGFKKDILGKVYQRILTFLNVKHWLNLIPIAPPKHKTMYGSEGPFLESALAKKWCKENLEKDYRSWIHITYNEDGTENLKSGTHIKQNELIKIKNLLDTTNDKSTITWKVLGISGQARIRPILDKDTDKYKFIVIYNKDRRIKK